MMGTDASARSKLQYAALTSSTRKFREDIAFIRALAIISVLCYHFWPTVFGLGFIGVDLFFVLSGYLIMTILAQDKSGPKAKLIDFYYKRVKRICPLYYMILLATVISCLFVYSGVWLAQFFPYFMSVILMQLNLKLYASDGDYFAESTENLPFVHTWSLAVEMQFYLVAPFLYYLTRLKIESQKVGVVFSLLIFMASLYFQWMSTAITAFYHPFSRIWQFLAGMLASHFSKEETKLQTSSPLIDFGTMGLLLPVFAIFLPYTGKLGPQNPAQFVVPAVTAIFLMISSYSDRIKWSRFRLNYIATISYALYLVHYPVLKYTQHLQPLYFESIPVSLIALPLTVLISMIFHHFHEKPMLHETKSAVLKHIGVLFVILLIVAFKWKLIFKTECAQSAIVQANRRFVGAGYFVPGGKVQNDIFKAAGSFGHFVWEENTGNLSVAIVGNSWASQQRYIVRKFLPGNMTSSCESYARAENSMIFHEAKNMTLALWQEMEKKQPKIVFILLRYNYYRGDLKPFLGEKNDTVLAYYQQAVDRLSIFADHIFVSSHHPFFCEDDFRKNNFLYRFMAALEGGQDMTKLNMPYNATEFAAHPVRVRLNILLKRCKKCHLLDLETPFIDKKKNWVKTYDPKTNLAYYDNSCHLTKTGLEMIEPQFEKAIHAALPEYFPNIRPQNNKG